MTRTNLVLLTALLALAAVLPASAQDDRPLRLLSFNIHHCEGVDGKTDIPRIARLIRSADPDLVALQEVDVNTSRSAGVDQAAELARLCEMQFRFGKTIDYAGGQYGNAVLSKLPIEASRNLLFPPHEGEQRAALEVTVRIGEVPLRFISTHFDHANPQARQDAADKLQQVMQQQRAARVVAGDLNCTPDSDVFQSLIGVLQRPDAETYPTIPVGNPTRQIDFVLFDKHNHWEFFETQVIDPQGASDHRPILTVARLR